jgi:purine nucleoside phosphorylase
MEPPRPTGDRLGVIVGSGLHGATFGAQPRTIDLTVPGADGHDRLVALEDCDTYVVLRRHAPSPGADPAPVPAHLVDHHANMAALCAAGCDRVLALASVGGLRRDWGVGRVVSPHDFLALGTTPTYHAGVGGHRVPGFDGAWRQEVADAWRTAVDEHLVEGGIYAQTRGPRFETPAEVRMLAHHADLVGMTVASEVILAGEAGLRYAALCKIDNLGNGLDTDPLTVAEYQANAAATLAGFVESVRRVIDTLAATAPTTA